MSGRRPRSLSYDRLTDERRSLPCPNLLSSLVCLLSHRSAAVRCLLCGCAPRLLQDGDGLDKRSAAARPAQSNTTSDYTPFLRLRHLSSVMCLCASASVWHALLRLMRHAARLRTVAQLSSNDPLVVCALSYLPSLTALGASCMWPQSFAVFVEQRSARTGRYRYVAFTKAAGHPHSAYSSWTSSLPISAGSVPTSDCAGEMGARRLPHR